MYHNRHGLISTDPWTIAIILGLIVLGLIVAIIYVHRRTIASDGLSPKEREEYNPEECDILSLLRQQGGPLYEKEIIKELPYEFEELTRAMLNLEENGLIQRKWISDSRSFQVSAILSS